MKRLRILVPLLVVFAMLASMLGMAITAMAQNGSESQAGNSVDVYLSVSPTVTTGDGIVNYTVTVANNAFVPGANNATVNVTFTPPGTDGTASGTAIVLATDLYVEVGEAVTYDKDTTPALAVTLNLNEGVEEARAEVDYSAVYDATPVYSASGTKDIPVTIVYEELTVSKTVETSFTRTHQWDIQKSVTTDNGTTLVDGTPKIWLWVDGSGDENAYWEVCVTYMGYEDSAHNVSGTITIENTGTANAVINNVEDILGGTNISADLVWPAGFSAGDTLAFGDNVTLTYSKDGVFTGENVVTVTTARDRDYGASEPIVWGPPSTENLKVVNVVDVSDLFGTEPLGTLDADDYEIGQDECFDYYKFFAWTDYPAPGPYIYLNEATITETGQSADAELWVNWMEPAELGDFVWHDLNRDGIQDAGEPGIEGVTVNLYDCDGTFLATTTTNASGYYLFDNLMPGEYKVEFVLPEGYVFSPQDADGEGIQGEVNSDADTITGMTDCVSLEAGDSKLFVDAGMYTEEECFYDDTAWAYGGRHANANWDFVNNRFWGWTNGPLSEGSYEFDLYAGAGQNDLSKGMLVGKVHVDYWGGEVTVTYEITEAGVYLGEVHLWVGNDVLPSQQRGRTSVYTNAPGLFPYKAYFDFESGERETQWTSYTIEITGDIYVAAHAVVWIATECPEEEEPNGVGAVTAGLAGFLLIAVGGSSLLRRRQ